MDYRRVPDNGGRVTGRGSCTISGVATSAEIRPSPIDPLWVAEALAMDDPRVIGAKKRVPARGATAAPYLRDRLRWMGFPSESRCHLRCPTRLIT